MSRPAGQSARSSRAGRRRSATPVPEAAPIAAERFWLAAIFAIALVIRLIHVWQIESIPLFYHLAGDGRTYDEWAQRIAGGDWLGQGVFYQAPLYPYFLGALQWLFGHDLWRIRFVQVLLGAFCCALICRIGEKLFSRPAGIAAGVILACYAPAIFFDAVIDKSILDLILLTVLLYFLVNVDAPAPWRQWCGAGALLGLLGLS